MKNYNNPIAIIGAGPVGLAAAAHLTIRNIPFVLFEAGNSVGASVLDWGHIRVFSPWKYNMDTAAVKLLEETSWAKPHQEGLPTGDDIVQQYLKPLSKHPRLEPFIYLNTKVVSVTKKGLHKMKSLNRDNVPFQLFYEELNGQIKHIETSGVIDASGTWFNPNPIGQAGVLAKGEKFFKNYISYRIPDIKGKDMPTYANKTVAVIGAGHSAINSLLDLASLKEEYPQTKIIWIIQTGNMNKIYGGKEKDALEERGKLGIKIHELVSTNSLKIYNPFYIEEIQEDKAEKIKIIGTYNNSQEEILEIDQIIANTGARPDFSFINEVRYDVDSSLESVPQLATLIDPNIHSCGTVRPHGEKELRQPDKNFYIVGVKSYGRAPTFLMATGYEQVRSIAAYLDQDYEAAARVELNLPETGVCSSGDDDAGACCAPINNSQENSCCDTLETMKTETNLNSNTMETNEKPQDENSTVGCCGGAPSKNEEACCKLDEEKKAEGLEGCGCGTITTTSKKSAISCC